MPATAFVLAAGLGTRLRPLTYETPKPLLPVGGRPMLDHVLDLLRRHGHDEVVVNAFWLADRIVDWAADKPGVRVVVEAPAVLGTGGGLKNAAHLLAERFVVVNGDILSDVDLGALWAVDAPAVMALRPQPTPVHTGVGLRGCEEISPVAPRSPRAASASGPRLQASGLRPRPERTGHPDGPRGARSEISSQPLRDGVVTGIAGVVGEADPGLHFTGVHALAKEALALVPAGEQCIVRTAYKALIPRGLVRGVVHTGRWTDIGTLAEYEAVRAGW